MTASGPPEPSTRRGHESIELSGHGFLIFAILFVSTLVMISLCLIWLFKLLIAGIPVEPPSAVTGRFIPQQPLLQGSIIHPDQDYQDLHAMYRAENQVLDNYRWVDRKAAIAAIPIDRAMQIVVQQGLLNRPPATAPATTRPSGSAGTPTTAPASSQTMTRGAS